MSDGKSCENCKRDSKLYKGYDMGYNKAIEEVKGIVNSIGGYYQGDNGIVIDRKKWEHLLTLLEKKTKEF